MRIQIKVKSGYQDRFGNFHDFNSFVDLPESIAFKLCQHGMAVLASAERESTERAAPENAALSKPQPRTSKGPGPRGAKPRNKGA